MEGQYTTIVADLTSLTGPYDMSLCNVGIMGTKYERLSQVVASTLDTGSGQGTITLDISHITVALGFEISNAILIKMR